LRNCFEIQFLSRSSVGAITMTTFVITVTAFDCAVSRHYRGTRGGGGKESFDEAIAVSDS